MVILLFFFLCSSAYAACYPDYDLCSVVSVVDGDTFKAECGFRGTITVRIKGVDAFETRRGRRLRRQVKATGITIEEGLARGRQARDCLSSLIQRRRVLLLFGDKRYDWYNRLLPDRILLGSDFSNLVDLIKNKCQGGLVKW